MSTEQFYWFIDRALIDSVLAMSWPTFVHKHPWPRNQLNELLTFSMESEPDGAAVASILASRTLRWTLQRSSPAYYFLNQIVHHVPRIRRQCPEVWSSPSENAVLTAVAWDAFLDDRIDDKTARAVHTITGSEDPRESLDLSRSELAQVRKALKGGAAEKPIFPWLDMQATQDGYRSLRSSDTRRFITFLTGAWNENWFAPRINGDARRELDRTGHEALRFRDFEVARELARHARARRFQKPCTLRYFG